MLLAIDASRANNEQKTGVEWYGYFVIQELKKIVPSDWQVILYTREPLRGDLAVLPSNWEVKVLKWLPKRLWTQIRLSWEIWRMKHVTKEKEEVTLFVPAHVLPLVCPAKVATTIHDLGGLRFPTGYSWFEKWYAWLATRLALKRAIVLTPSEFVRQEILKLFKSEPSKVRVVPNAYDKEMFHLIADKEKIAVVLKKYNIQLPYFLSISRLEEKKNTAGIIEAFEIFRSQKLEIGGQKSEILNHKSEMKLVLLGKPGFGFSRVQSAISHSPFRDDIILPGWVATADVPYLMAGATAFVFPSFYEGFGIPVLEAMACSVPVIAANRAALPEVCQDAAILINPYKPAEIAQAMFQIIFSPQLREDMIKKGLERVKKYSWEKTAGEVWEILRSLDSMV